MAKWVNRSGRLFKSGATGLTSRRKRIRQGADECDAHDTSAYAKTTLALASDASLDLDFVGLLKMKRVVYSGRCYTGELNAENTPFIQGGGRLYAAVPPTILLAE